MKSNSRDDDRDDDDRLEERASRRGGRDRDDRDYADDDRDDDRPRSGGRDDRFRSPTRGRRGSDDSDLGTGEWVAAILCPGIGCIIGLIWLLTGNPKGGKMFGFSLLFAVIWNVITFAIRAGMGIN